jgi:hypothetical protein
MLIHKCLAHFFKNRFITPKFGIGGYAFLLKDKWSYERKRRLSDTDKLRLYTPKFNSIIVIDSKILNRLGQSISYIGQENSVFLLKNIK